ncbi:MAG TPA: TIGR02680 family protein [Clostridia bacterium]|nr:TIGR02680 family protein [Clostridia bacterium]
MSRWMLHRMGLVNFWFYDEEEFDFANGKLLLRGSNGSGKSVTMQSFIPLMLDGNKSPERLDPFGSRARKLEDYLLGEEGSRSYEERTGYLYMEFKMGTIEQFLTIGMGLKARKGRPVDFWGFTITDGRRMGKDISLYRKGISGEDGHQARIPLSKGQMKELVGEGGVFVTAQKDYMDMVNRQIFGFDTVEEYDELIKLLIQLRSPKLSKEFKPTVIYEIMNSSLPALSDDDLRPLTETIESMDQIKLHLDQLVKNQKALSKLKEEYHGYNRLILYERSKNLKHEQINEENMKIGILHLKDNLEKDAHEIETLLDTITSLEHEEEALKLKERQYLEHDAYRLEQEWVEKGQLLEELKTNKSQKQSVLKEKQRREWELKDELERLESKIAILQRQNQDILIEMDDLADDIRFHDHEYDRAELERSGKKSFDFTAWYRDAKLYSKKLKEGRIALEEELEANRHYDNLLKEQDDLIGHRDMAFRQEESSLEQVDLTRRDYMTLIQSWSDKSRVFTLASEDILSLNQLVLKYGEGEDFNSIQHLLNSLYQPLAQKLNRELVDLEHSRDGLRIEMQDVMDELQDWKRKKDPEPARDQQVTDFRVQLKKESIPFLPLYQSVEFQEDLDDVQKGNLEAALEDMGLLDALIIPQKFQEKAMGMLGNGCDKIIVSSPKLMTTNLTQFLRACRVEHENVSLEEIDDALTSIMAYRDEQGFFIEDDGSYGMGIVKGKARGRVSSKYIGAESRKRYRLEVIEGLEKQLNDMGLDLDNIRTEINDLNGKITLLEEDRANFPKTEDLDVALEMLYEAARELRFLEDKLTKHDKLLGEQLKVVQGKKAETYQKTKGIDLASTLPAFIRAEEGMGQYWDSLHQLDKSHHNLVLETRLADTKEEQYGEIQEDVDILKGEINGLEDRIKACQRTIEELDDLRNRPEFKEMQEEINRCIKRIGEIPKQIREAIDRRGRLEQAHITDKDRLEGMEREQGLISKRVELLYEGFVQEYNLGFTPLEEELVKGHSIKDIPAIVLSQWKTWVDRWGGDKTLLGERLQKVTYEVLPELTEYGISMGVKFDTSEEEDEFAHIRSQFRRFLLTGRLEGRQVSIYELDTWLVQEIDIHDNLLRDTDRQLFEEIIMQTVGRKIRAKIYRAEEWVKNMNRLMTERDASNGLAFYLQWKPRVAQNEDELDTRDLVSILRTDANILKIEDFNKVTEHFRSQVERAKRILDNNVHGQTFHNIIRDILDYRDWFEFVLYYKKEGENRKELTNRAFYRMSGGEKAMAMYIPLFSSVYSRYESADQQAPRLISLDEAFAGVDEQNIRDMFQLTEELDFNYIINSQILWGDYDTVDRLSICELLRPNNANFVSVIRYLWDGESRRIVLDEEREELAMAGVAKG